MDGRTPAEGLGTGTPVVAFIFEALFSEHSSKAAELFVAEFHTDT